ncbi:hypothetical protein KC318_g1799 [Hortaea werneckii]|nr:hypothetical protein KC334_g7099 [Hortaea werneckii]KAI7023102.1 hypothetical protein KC355_g1835 [Hortaea werneckii]KAI7674126.1 hypothetical protein KC318_g1799 [Hortaea werneckii]
MFQIPTTTTTRTTMTMTITATHTPLFAGLEVSYPFTTTTSKSVGEAEGSRGEGGLTTLFGPSTTARDPFSADLVTPAAPSAAGTSSSAASSSETPTPRSSAPARLKGTGRPPSELRLRKRNVAGLKVALGRLRVRIALEGETDEGTGEEGGEVDFNRFERKGESVLRGVVGLEREMKEGFEGSGVEVGEAGDGNAGRGEDEGEDGAHDQEEDQGQVGDEDEDEAEAEVERYGEEDEESGPEDLGLEDLLLSTDLLSLSDSKAMYAQWEDRKPPSLTPRADDIREQEQIDTAFVEAIHASNAVKWGNSASIRDISPSPNDTSTTKASQKRPSARATQQTPFKLHVPRDYGNNPYYTADTTLEDAAKQIRLTLTEANASCKQWTSLSCEEFESLIQSDRDMQARLNAMCQDLGYMAQLVEYGREGWDSAALSKMVLHEICEVGGELVERLRALAGYKGCELLEKIAVAPLVRVWKGLSE